MLGLTLDKVIILALIAVLLVGPDRLPHYAEQLARFARRVKELLASAQVRARQELGPEFEQVDWKKMDPRQYDPRQIIRDVLFEETPAPTATGEGPKAEPLEGPRAALADPLGDRGTSDPR